MAKKIIILNHGLHIAGVSRVLVNFANALVAHGYDVTVKLEIPDYTLADELDPRVKLQLFLKQWRLFGRRVPGFLRFYHRFLQKIQKISAKTLYRRIMGGGYDVEIAFNRGAAARIIAASDSEAKKLVWVHSDYTRCENALAGFENLEQAKAAYGKFHHIVCVSKHAEQAFREKLGEYRTLVHRNNIMNFDSIRGKAQTFVPEKMNFTFCAVGRVSVQKNYAMLLDAAKVLQDKGYSFSMWILGDGDNLEEIAAKRDTLGLWNVTLLGARENPYPYMAAADCYVSSSVCEGLSTTTIEALVLGKACVVTDCTGMRDILGNSEYGLVVPITVQALADGMERLMKDESLRKHYEEKALRQAEEFDSETSFCKIRALWE